MEEPKHIKELMVIQNSNQQAIVKSQPLPLGPSRLLQAIQQVKVKNEDKDVVSKMFRHLFLLVGLREKSIPNDIETLFLYQFIVDNYGEHTAEEIKLAFGMAVKGELDLPYDDVTCYENFSTVYFARIMNSYRRWAGQAYREIEPMVTDPKEEEKFYQGERKDIHWGYYIDQAYNHFLSFKDEGWQKFPVDFYNQLEQDGLIAKDYWRRLMNGVRDHKLKELYHLKNKYHASSTKGMANDRMKLAESIRQTNIQSCDDQISDFKSGKRDGELEVIAKQRSVIKLFELYKAEFKEHVYEPAD